MSYSLIVLRYAGGGGGEGGGAAELGWAWGYLISVRWAGAKEILWRDLFLERCWNQILPGNKVEILDFGVAPRRHFFRCCT